MQQEPGIHVFKIYLQEADTNDRPRPIGTIRADSQALALDKAAQFHEKPAHDLLAEQENMYSYCALDASLQPIYEQAQEALAKYGSEQGKHYCRRLNLYISEQEVSTVAALERVLLALEEARDPTHALAMLRKAVPPGMLDQETYSHYLELVRDTGPDTRENEQAVTCAVEQTLADMPYIEVINASLYKRTETFGDRPNLAVQGVRWYVEVEVRNTNSGDENDTATVLCRVWRTGQGLKAIRVTVQ